MRERVNPCTVLSPIFWIHGSLYANSDVQEGGIGLKISHISVVMILVIVIAVACAGCSGTNQPPAAPSGGTGGQAASGGGGQSSGTGSAAGLVGGDQLFGAVSYNWVEYKMTSGSGSQQMTIYFKYDKSGKCTMRFEGAQKIEGMPTEMDCSSTGGGGKSADNPNKVSSDVKFTRVGTESVTVPAGTFTADKYTASYQGMTSTYWIVNGKPLIKMVGGSAEGSAVMELNSWG
jgi:hypothetical protein